MVAPLDVLALVWGRRDWRSSRLLHGRRVRLGYRRLGADDAAGQRSLGHRAGRPGGPDTRNRSDRPVDVQLGVADLKAGEHPS
jgi:hypothetical protein